MTHIHQRHVEVNGITMQLAEAGTGPLVLLLHGFPETTDSWCHQLRALAEAGYHAVAPSQRGYPGSSRPERVSDYTIHHLIGDAVGVIGAVGADDAVLVGHDFGSDVAAGTARTRPDLVRGVALLGVPFVSRSSRSPLERLRARYGEEFYQVYFQEPGVAEREFESDLVNVLRKMFFWYSGDAPEVRELIVDENGLTGSLPTPEKLPPWISEEEITASANAFAEAGTSGALNWYRNITRNWELTSAWNAQVIDVPTMFLGGDRDPVLEWFDKAGLRQYMARAVSNLTSYGMVEGAGHWLPQERPDETNAALIDFIRSVSRSE